VLIDLGCGDGRVLEYACYLSDQGCRPRRAIGVEFDPYLYKYAAARLESLRIDVATQSPLAKPEPSRVVVLHDDMFNVSLVALEATVLVLYLLPDGLERLKEQFAAWLTDGSSTGLVATKRIITIGYRIPMWTPSCEEEVAVFTDTTERQKSTRLKLFRYVAESMTT
jgi:hypothetical protein